MQSNVLGTNQIFSEMEEEKPYKSYKKQILGQVAVVVWDNFNGVPTEIILKGNHRSNDEGCIVDTWSQREDVFFNRVNKKLIDRGLIAPFSRPTVTEPTEKPVEQSSDEELLTILNSRFFSLQAKLNGIFSQVVLFRLLELAHEEEKSEKIVKAIEARLSEVQTAELTPTRNTELDEEEE